MRTRPRADKKQQTQGELALIERIRDGARSGTQKRQVILGIGDDCAILSPPAGSEILVTTDFSLEGRHFRRSWHIPQSVGHRTLARGLSDLASMGGEPLAAFLSLALPRSITADRQWLDGFLEGLLGLSRQHRTPLAGGDTSESPSEHVLADIVVLGSAPAGTALRRSGARPGDMLYCTGSLGGSAAELAALARQPDKKLRGRKDHPQLFPTPRLRAGRLLRERALATACIDLSDGLSTDLAHLCSASGVRAEVNAAALPLHALVSGLPAGEALRLALHGGEDYELLFTAAPKTKVPRSLGGVPVSRIGRILSKRRGFAQVMLLQLDGTSSELEPAGWEHLR